ncbi:DNA-binding NarL/FixJ family response regulator [Kibdelosporangium banguiense]|uniref:DNA-binding NarL/FixJ family response regulator n=1 Tax=Kibdelosporangium banguiense TaxID=1365924 RepID=A0ABS4TSL2_9PSEU|nr:helix-turn-helix transcriptional regulator [Kibdelosporangium banguiense]MBP2327393.1 DNA-binding NarL/FixJ family response regulator [Kibdelosporangium banguiense]
MTDDDPSFVGRVKQRALLGEALTLAAGGRRQVVLLGGVAGVGKSRLAEYLAAASKAHGTRVLFGSCAALGSETLPLSPFISALRRLMRELGAEGVTAAFPEGFRVECLLSQLIGTLPDGEVSEYASVFQELITVVEGLSTNQPILLILDDIHEADPSTRKLLSALARTLDTARLMILATYRTDDLHRGHPLRSTLAELQRVRGVRQLSLDHFTRAETAELITHALGRRPSGETLDRIHTRSDGNAFFIKQLVQAESAGKTGLPDSLRDLLLGRVEQLPHPTQRIVQLVAMGGPWVSHQLVTAVAAVDQDELLTSLRSAVDANVLTSNDDGYDFQHALVREVVTDALLPGERIRMHHLYAAALELQPNLVPPEHHAARIAHHWLGAQRPDRALPALVRAASVAARFHAYSEQLQMLASALDVLPSVVEPQVTRLELLEAAAYASWRAVENDQAQDYIDQALADADPVIHTDRVAELLALRSRTLLRRGGQGALIAAQDAQRLALPRRSPTYARVLEVLSAALTSEGQTEKAQEVSQQAVRLAVELGDQELEVAARSTAGLAFSHLGQHELAVIELRRAQEVAGSRGDMAGLTRACVNLSMELWAYGRHEEAISVASAGMHAARRAGLARSSGMYAITNLASSLMAIGRWDTAEHVLTEALEERPCDVYRAYPHLVLAELAVGRGDSAAAHEHHAVASETLSIRAGRSEARLPLARLAAEIALLENRIEDAQDIIGAVLNGFHVTGQSVTSAWPLLTTAARVEVQARAQDVGPDTSRLLTRIAATLSTNATSWHAAALQVTAELASVQAPSPQWYAVAAAWEHTNEPYPTSYARLRAAEAAAVAGNRADAQRWLTAAAKDARPLGQTPLLREIDRLTSQTRTEEPKLGLTPRETEVLRLLAEGLPNKMIAERLVITEKTVSVHVSRILGKLAACNRTHAAAMARRLGLLGT